MSWTLKRNADSGEFCVVAEQNGEPAGCHATREAAEKQVLGLYLQEGEELAETAIRDSLTEATGVTPEAVEFAGIENNTAPE